MVWVNSLVTTVATPSKWPGRCTPSITSVSPVTETVVEKPEYLSLFGGKAAGAFAVYHHQHDHTHLPDGRVRHADGSVTDNCHPGDGHHEPQSDGKRTKDHTHA